MGHTEVVQHLVQCGYDSTLVLNTTTTKIIMDLRKSTPSTHKWQRLRWSAMSNFFDSTLHFIKDLMWMLNTSHLVKKAQYRLFLGTFKKNKQKNSSQLFTPPLYAKNPDILIVKTKCLVVLFIVWEAAMH